MFSHSGQFWKWDGGIILSQSFNSNSFSLLVLNDWIGLFSLFPFLYFSYNNRRKRMKTRPNGTPFGFVFSFSLWVGVRARHPSFFIQWGISMNIQEQHFKGVPNYYPSMYLDGYTPQQINFQNLLRPLVGDIWFAVQPFGDFQQKCWQYNHK